MTAATTHPAPPEARPQPATGLLARNTFLNLTGYVLPLVVGVISMPAVFAGLGAERFGLLGLVWAALAFLNLLDLGLGRATTKFAAEAIERNDVQGLGGIAGVAALMQLATSALGGIALALAAPWLVARLNVSPALYGEALWSLIALAAGAPVVILTNTFRGLLEAAQRFDVVNAVRAPVSTTNFLIPLVGVWLEWPLVGIVGAMIGARAVALAIYATACFRLWPALRQPLRVERSRVRELAGFGGWVTVSGIVSPLLVYLDRFAIGALVTVAAVGYYSAPHEMVMRLDIVPVSLVATLFPAFATLSLGRGSGSAAAVAADARLDQMVAGGMKYVLALIGPLLIVLALLSRDVLDLWLGGEFAARSGTALTLLSAGMLLNALAFVPYALLQAAGRPDLTAKFHLVELPLHALVLWLMVRAWGIPGAAAAWSLRVMLDALLLYGAAVRLRLVSGATFRSRQLPRLAGSLVLLCALGAILTRVADSPAVRIAGVAALVLVWGAWTAVYALAPEERRQLRSALSRHAPPVAPEAPPSGSSP